MSKRLLLLAGLVVVFLALSLFGRFNQSFLQNNVTYHSAWFLPVLIVAAAVDSLNPCAISVLLLTIAFLASLGRTRKSIVLTGSAYIFGIFLLYILIGLGIVGALVFFDTPHVVARIGA
ncbi:MAG TPA: hypothetical protein VMC43_03055, partial [Candidatus Paceibacterota bacterium]|nr:hypothetical protein [Candidatus Paceibacterota bacterium]